jgi:hypothetical protein
MARSPLLAGLILLTFVACARGQTTKPAKKTPFDNVAGYKVHQLAGFTVIVSDEVLNADTANLKRKPLECLELELKNVVALMNTKAADALRKVPIWAEWNEVAGVANGRQGQAYAVYYGGNQINMLAKNMNPLKAKCVVLLLTKTLTRNYQEKDRPETLVLLHELAHAVHDQLLGNNSPAVKAAYQQAMARKLYDKSLYIATNEHEFFAEASCAYLDRLDYFPKNREDLKKHDPETFKFLDTVWGKSAVTTEANKSKRPTDGSENFVVDIRLDKLKWPKLIAGEKPETTGRVVLLAYAHHEQGAFLSRLRNWQEEFGPYGLSIVLVNAEYRTDPEASAAAFRKLNLPFPLTEAFFLPAKEGPGRSEKPGHAALFNIDGQCIFRGQIDDTTIYIKEAIGQRLFQKLSLSESEIPKQLLPAITALQGGEPLAGVAVKAQAFATSNDAALGEPAKKIVAMIAEPGTTSLAAATAMKKDDPVEAFLAAEKVAARFKGLPVAAKANKLIDDLRFDKSVQSELKARKDLEAVTKLETLLSSQAGSFAPKESSFQSKHAAMLRQLKETCDAMKKKHPNAKATQQAVAIAKEYGVD